MITLTIDIPRPPMTANDQRRWHWRKVARAKNEAETLVWAAARAARIPTLTAKQAISVTWYAPNAIRRDSDALSPFLKATLDALVKCGALVDDDHKHVRIDGLDIQIDRTHPRIEITIEETQ